MLGALILSNRWNHRQQRRPLLKRWVRMISELQERKLFYETLAAHSDWDEATNSYETQRRLRLVFDILLGECDIRGARLLDAGSGGGHFSAEAKRRGAQVISLDLGRNLLAQVRHRCHSRRVLGSVLELPFAPESFDVVLSTEVIEHTPQPTLALRELARALKPGGRLVVTTPSRLWQPIVRAASAVGLRRYQGFENFIWPRTARLTLESEGISVGGTLGFNLLPVFLKAAEPVHRIADTAGRILPGLYVNFAIYGTKLP